MVRSFVHQFARTLNCFPGWAARSVSNTLCKKLIGRVPSGDNLWKLLERFGRCQIEEQEGVWIVKSGLVIFQTERALQNYFFPVRTSVQGSLCRVGPLALRLEACSSAVADLFCVKMSVFGSGTRISRERGWSHTFLRISRERG